MRSAVRKEDARNKDGQLTNWKTERRFVFMQFLQLTPLPKIMLNCRTEKRRRREKRAETEKCANCWLPDHAAATPKTVYYYG